MEFLTMRYKHFRLKTEYHGMMASRARIFFACKFEGKKNEEIIYA